MEKISQTRHRSGLVETIGVEDDRMVVKREQDITASLEYAQALRNDDEVWKTGVKRGMVKVGHIPDGVIHELLQIGVNVYTCSIKDLVWGLKRINREACLTTRKQIA